MTQPIPREDIINDLQEISEKLDKDNISMNDYRDHGTYSMDAVLNHFDKWNKAKEVAGLRLNQRKVDRQQLVRGLKALHDELGTAPTEEQMDECGPFASTTYQRHFDSWGHALRLADDYYDNFDYNPSRHRPAGGSVPA